ncbi:EAL domain-containing protein [Caulobacter sp. FWC2]|uniref:EAL domain-containing protein n=1 Tax=Caulobacter sp. FWC2 TaxID=69664 RepID=UPI000C153B48|nr:EAL domain-containing protein [Caulobacter sp. FWC2]PIB90756.1 diguanylate phosphodiesterase [Caulobacter sp. FWC2]
MAFQPIVNLASGQVFAHEALVRGLAGEGAGSVLSTVSEHNRYVFDQQCRVKAIELATSLGMAETGAHLSINFMPNAVYEPRACIRLTLATAMRTGFPLDKLIFEFTENEQLDTQHILNILRTYRAMGFKTAIDDFGAGYAGLNLLAKYQPDIVKLDMELIRDIDRDRARRAIVSHLLAMLTDLGVTTVCEGVETEGELAVLRDLGVELVQGYVIARPLLEGLAVPAPSLAADTPSPRRNAHSAPRKSA